MLLSLLSPFPPLSSDRVGSLTKLLLHRLGVPVRFWGPHSTRGAGVRMYKDLGLSSEEVCELGKWKNHQAFASHYLRLGAAASAATFLNPVVHNVSPRDCAEPDQSRTPGMEDLGGSDWEGEAQDIGEPTRPPRSSFRFAPRFMPYTPPHADPFHLYHRQTT